MGIESQLKEVLNEQRPEPMEVSGDDRLESSSHPQQSLMTSLCKFACLLALMVSIASVTVEWVRRSFGTVNTGSNAKFFGVNYGNRFVPEKWMLGGNIITNTSEDNFFWEGVIAQGTEPGADHLRLSLPDLGAEKFAERMPRWLDMMVLESDFAKMNETGVEVVRVPCGYWNWISYAPGEGPDAPAKDAERMKVLTALPPSSYKPYFDKIFEWAENYGLKVLLDLHGVPGSANGAEHGGICIEQPYWNTPSNIDKTIETVGAMAAYCADKGDTLYGIQVINEPMNFGTSWLTRFQVYITLNSFYERAILEVRKHLAANVPVVLFEWTYLMFMWPNDRFPESKFGKVMWDTHIYTVWQSTYTLEETKNVYMGDLPKLKRFNDRQAGGAIVGEWSIAGTYYDDAYPDPALRAGKLRNLAEWVVRGFMERSTGCLYWNLDGIYTEWSYERAMNTYGIDWAGMIKPAR